MYTTEENDWIRAYIDEAKTAIIYGRVNYERPISHDRALVGINGWVNIYDIAFTYFIYPTKEAADLADSLHYPPDARTHCIRISGKTLD